MAQETDSVESKKPLSLFEKVKSGVTHFVKASIDYLPRGLIFSAIIYGGAALLGHPMGMAQMAWSMALGVAISGSAGAWSGVKADTARRNGEIAAQADELQRCRENGPERHQETEYSLPSSQQQGLPMGIPSKQPQGFVRQ